jgi:hypothetical protein
MIFWGEKNDIIFIPEIQRKRRGPFIAPSGNNEPFILFSLSLASAFNKSLWCSCSVPANQDAKTGLNFLKGESARFKPHDDFKKGAHDLGEWQICIISTKWDGYWALIGRRGSEIVPRYFVFALRQESDTTDGTLTTDGKPRLNVQPG